MALFYTFSTHLRPFLAGYIHAKGVATTLNIHDASGVNNWEAMFPALVKYLGLPPTSTKVRV